MDFSMLIILPALVLILTNQLFLIKGQAKRIAFLYSLVVLVFMAVVYVELGSFFSIIGLGSIVMFWLSILVILVAVYWWNNRGFVFYSPIALCYRSKTAWLCFCVMIVFLLVTAMLAWVAPPNTWDAMTYHLSRVMHWIQNKTVAFYPTHITRQLFVFPLAEYLILHCQLLAGTDRFANFVQWFSMVGSLVGVSLIAKQLGGTLKTQWFAVVLLITLPAGILQSTSTQTDYVVTFWVITCIVLVLRLLKRFFWIDALMLSLVLGLGCLAKGSFLIWVVFFIVAVVVQCARYGWKKALGLLLGVMLSLMLILGPHLIRLHDYKNNKGGWVALDYLKNDAMSVPLFTSNLVRHLSMHAALPSQYWNNKVVRQGVVGFHQLLGLKPDDPRITAAGNSYYVFFQIGEDEASNFFHMLFLVFSVLIMLVLWRKIPHDLKMYLLFLMGSLVVFCVFTKWQPWVARFHLPWFVALCPWLACIWEKVGSRKAIVLWIVLTVVVHLPWLFGNNIKKVFSKKHTVFSLEREIQYFMKSFSLHPSTVQKVPPLLAKHGCQHIGLIIGEDTWEYPWWVGFNRLGLKDLRIEHINVDNGSKTYPYPLGVFQPCAIIEASGDYATRTQINYQGVKYKQWGYSQNVIIYKHP